jgi:hypothetical protein
MLTFAAKCRKFFCEKINEPFRIRRQALYALTRMQLTPCTLSRGFILKERQIHRVDRVPGFFSSRPNWDPCTPSPSGECVLPFGSERGGHTRLRERGWGVPIRTREQTPWYFIVSNTSKLKKKRIVISTVKKSRGKDVLRAFF